MVGGRPGWRGSVGAVLVAVVAVVAVAYPLGVAGQPGLWIAAAAVAVLLGMFGPGVVSYLNGRDRRGRLDTVEASRMLVAGDLSVAGLLNPVDEVVTFTGRTAQLAALDAWCADDDASVVRLVVAAGGVGKTRLARHWAGQMAGQGWQCWALAAGAEVECADKIGAGGVRRLLVTVDYAEARAGAVLARLLVAAARTPDRVRVLLLARTAGPWWRYLSLTCEVDQASAVDALTGPAGNVLELPVAADERDPARVIADATADFARELGLPIPAGLPAAPDDGGPLLRLHARALLAVLGYDGGGDEFDRILRHETRYWRGRANRRGVVLPSDPQRAETVLRQVVAVAVLLGVDDPGDIAGLIRRTPALAGIGDDAVASWAGWLADLYPGVDGRLGVIQPDLVAETLAAEVLAGWASAQRRVVFAGVDEAQAVRALTVVGRAGAHHRVDEVIEDMLSADVATMMAAVIDTARQFPGRYTTSAIRVLNQHPDTLTLPQRQALTDRMPRFSLELGHLATALTAHLLAGTDLTDIAARAGALNDLANRLAGECNVNGVNQTDRIF